MNSDLIRSHDNQTIKYVRSLRQRSVRRAERAFVVEGVRAVDDALALGAVPRVLLVRDDSDWTPPRRRLDDLVRWVDGKVFDRLADTATPQPVMGVFDLFEVPVLETTTPLFLVVDGLQDPGNLGTLIRSAAAAGVAAVLLSSGSVDPYNPKAVRAAMGAHLRVAIQELDDDWIGRLEGTCALRVLAEADGEVDYPELDWTGPTALIVGSEAHGPGEAGRALATVSARIPLLGDVESLNAGVAGSVLMFEAARQRRAR